MIKTITKEIHACDKCGTETLYHKTCLKCGIEMCSECSEKLGVDFRHALYFMGSDDGFYCKPCDSELTKSQNDKLHNAYMSIRDFARESENWNHDFEIRRKTVENEIQRLLKKERR
jgi:hypothetical protein